MIERILVAICRAVCANCCRVGTRKILLTGRFHLSMIYIIPLLGSWGLELLCTLVRVGWQRKVYVYPGIVVVARGWVGGGVGVAVLMVCKKLVFHLVAYGCSSDEACTCGRPPDIN